MSVWRNFHVRDGVYFRLKTAREIEDERFLIVRAASFEDAGEVLFEMTRSEFASAIAEVITLAELNFINERFGIARDQNAASRTKAALSAKAGHVAKKIAEYDADDTRTCSNDGCDWYCEHWKADVATIIVDELEKAEL